MFGAFAGKRILVVGAGKTGLAVARFCANRGGHVTISDRRSASEMMPAGEAIRPDIEWELGGHTEKSFLSADLIVVSPGVPEIAELAAARRAGVAVTGEIELAARFIKAPIVAITGTNGKSTTTALAGEIAHHTGRPTFVGGNLGTPLVTAVGTAAAGESGLVVVELSSFQLETCELLHPRAAALLNLTPDHLDRYTSMEGYGAAKLRVARHMTDDDALVVNADDEWLMRASEGRKRWRFSLRGAASEAWVDGNQLVVNGERYDWSGAQLVGRHNQANALAALLLMRASGLATYQQAAAGLSAFRPLPHRMQLVGERRGVRYYDDSKATNVDSVVAGIDGFPRPFVLIAGGRDKGGSYAPMNAALQHNSCRAVVLIGEAADKLDQALTTVDKVRAATLQEAVVRASSLARTGDAVLLSPACSSYDMFENYEHRGRVFKQAVEALADE